MSDGTNPGPLPPPRHAGDLELRPLPAVLLDLHEAHATGRFLVRRDRVVKNVDLLDGAIVVGSVRDPAIGHFLVASGVITHEQHQEALAAVGAGTIGEALIAAGLLTPDGLREQLAAQTRYRLLSPLRWSVGAWRFEARPLTVDGDTLPIPETVLTGLRDTAAEGSPPSQLLADLFLELTARGQRLVPKFRAIYGARLPDRLPEGVTAKGMIEQGVPAAVVDALLLTDAVVPAIPRVGPALSLRSGETGERSPLYTELFDGLSTVAPLPTGGDPLELGEAPLDEDLLDDDATRAARTALTSEALRIRDLDHYAVLLVDPRATDLEISAALAERQSSFARDYYARYSLGSDAALLDDVHAAYQDAHDTLLSDERRAAYDRELAGGDLTDRGVESERQRAAGFELLRRGDAAGAASKFEAVLALRPDDPEALAGLGWALWHREERTPEAADAARAYLTRALRLAPQLGHAHQHLGLIELAMGVDDQAALEHLERAARAIPGDLVVLDAIATLYLRRNAPRALERCLRRLLRAGAGTPHDQAVLWQRLGTLYSDHLDDAAAARTAFAQAARLGGASRPVKRIPTPLPAATSDADFIAASLAVAAGTATELETRTYEELRPRTVPRARTTMSRELWALLRHPDDESDLGALAELLAPALDVLHPITLADLAVDPAARCPDGELPPAFAGLRGYLADLLDLPRAPVYAHPDFGADVHVGALAPPVLLAGDDALTAPDRAALGFRLARATTYLWPGRAAGASRPARALRALLMALHREATSEVVRDDAREALAVLPEEVRRQAAGLVGRMLARSPEHNVSRWAQALGRTADRFGLLVCGDLPVALSLAGNADGSLVEFARSSAFATLRAELGLTIDGAR
jgi:tetratricopeptide (TPR) repeat protein